jgi:hypothetical protein
VWWVSDKTGQDLQKNGLASWMGVWVCTWESGGRVGRLVIRSGSWDRLYTLGTARNGVCHLGSSQPVCEGETGRSDVAERDSKSGSA